MLRWLVSLLGTVVLSGPVWAQEPTPPPTPLEQCQNDLRAQILDYRQCQASCANAQFRAERLLTSDIQAALRERDRVAQERYDKLLAEYEALKQQRSPTAAAAQ